MRTILDANSPDYDHLVGQATWRWLADTGFDENAYVTVVEMIDEGFARVTCLEQPTRVVDRYELATYTVDWEVRSLPPFMVET